MFAFKLIVAPKLAMSKFKKEKKGSFASVHTFIEVDLVWGIAGREGQSNRGVVEFLNSSSFFL